MSIDNSKGYPVINFGCGTVCLTTVRVDGVPGVSISYACQHRQIGDEVGAFVPGTLLEEDTIGASLVFHSLAGLENFLHHIEEVRFLLLPADESHPAMDQGAKIEELEQKLHDLRNEAQGLYSKGCDEAADIIAAKNARIIELETEVQAALLAGFAISNEGNNGEYPFEGDLGWMYDWLVKRNITPGEPHRQTVSAVKDA